MAVADTRVRVCFLHVALERGRGPVESGCFWPPGCRWDVGWRAAKCPLPLVAPPLWLNSDVFFPPSSPLSAGDAPTRYRTTRENVNDDVKTEGVKVKRCKR